MDIYRLYNLIDANKINEFVKDSQEEHLTLEFKTVSKADFTDREDRKNFAKALSGFANSSGGLVIWGVEAKKNQQGFDCAYGIKQIIPLPLFMSKLNEFTGQFVNPIVEGVKHKKVVSSGDKGFAVTLIPESDAGPHMAKAGVTRYYKRSGDSFYKMEHFDIEDMFGRRKKPKLSLCVDIKSAGGSSGPEGKKYDCHVWLGIKNSGRGIAKYAALAIEVKKPYHLVGDIKYHTGKDYGFQKLEKPSSKKTVYSLGANIVIHPKSSLLIALVAFRIGERQQEIKDVVIDAEIMAEDIRTVEEKKVVSGKEIRSRVVPNNT